MDKKDIIIYLIQAGVLGAIIYIVPNTVKLIKATIGEKNYNYAKDYVTQQYKLHPEWFNAENLVNLIDTLDNKFGDRLSRDTIKRIVDVVISDFKAAK